MKVRFNHNEPNNMKHPNKTIMQKAIDFGYKNHTVGCLIIKGNKIIAQEKGTIFTKKHDATGHSEINTIRKACKTLGTHELKNCWIYTTYEPCPMCMAAICWAKIKGVVYAANHKDRNNKWKWEILIPSKEIIKRSEHKPKIIGDFLREEALGILEL